MSSIFVCWLKNVGLLKFKFSGNLGTKFLFAKNFALYKHIETCTFFREFLSMSGNLTKVTFISNWMWVCVPFRQ